MDPKTFDLWLRHARKDPETELAQLRLGLLEEANALRQLAFDLKRLGHAECAADVLSRAERLRSVLGE